MCLGWSTVIKLSHAGIAVSVMRSDVAPLRLVSSPSSIHSQFIFKTEVNVEKTHFLQITVSWAAERRQKWQSPSDTATWLRRDKKECAAVALVDRSFYSARVGSEKSSSSLNITLTLNDILLMVDGDSKTRNVFTLESCITLRAVKDHPSMCRMKIANRRWLHTVLCFAALDVPFVIQRGLMCRCLVCTGNWQKNNLWLFW